MEKHIKTILPLLDERQARLFLGSIAKELGHGGVKRVCAISGVSAKTVTKGKKELDSVIYWVLAEFVRAEVAARSYRTNTRNSSTG